MYVFGLKNVFGKGQKIVYDTKEGEMGFEVHTDTPEGQKTRPCGARARKAWPRVAHGRAGPSWGLLGVATHTQQMCAVNVCSDLILMPGASEYAQGAAAGR